MKKKSIVVVYHKKARTINGSDFLLVNAGRKRAPESEIDWLKENTVGDDTGENISEKNPSYNELTAIYWAWKNVDSDYYGLMHYRRFFVFEERDKAYYSVSEIKGEIENEIKYDEEKLDKMLGSNDFIAPMPMKRKSVYEHYKNAHDVADLEAVMYIIKTQFPQYAQSCDEYIYGKDSYFYNMFVFDKETFNRYCTFIFGVLFRCEKRFKDKRMFVSERLTGIFITQLIKEGKKGLFLPTLYLDKKPPLKDAIVETKKNLALRKQNGGGLKSLIYAYKPLLTSVLPSFIFRLYRNHK